MRTLKIILALLFFAALAYPQRQTIQYLRNDTLDSYKKSVLRTIKHLGVMTAADSALTSTSGHFTTNLRVEGVLTVGSLPGFLVTGDSTSQRNYSNLLYLLKTTISGLANPTASVGLSAVNGAAITAMRSDASPALSQSITPTWTGNHNFRGRIYQDSSGQFIDRNARITVFRTDTANANTNAATIWLYQLSRGDSGASFNGRTGIYSKTVEDTTNNGANGRKRGVLVGAILSVVPYTENEPYTVNRDATNLILDNQGSAKGTEAIFLGGSAFIPTTAANPNRYRYDHSIRLADTVGVGISFTGAENIGIDLSDLGTIATDPLAVKTKNSAVSQFGTIRGSAASGENLTITSTSHGTKGKILLGASSAYDEVNTRLGIGLTSPGAVVDVSGVSTTTSGTVHGLQSTLSANPASTSTAVYRNTFVSQSQAGNAQTIAGLRAGNFTAIHNGTNTVTDMFGTVSIVQKASTGNVTNAYAGYFRVDNNDASGTIGTATGVHIAAAVETGTITTNWGLYQAGAADRNYLAGNTTLGSTTATSLLNVGSAAQFQVNSSGNIVLLNNVTTSFPSSQGAASSFLKNNGSGTLTWNVLTDTVSKANVFTGVSATDTLFLFKIDQSGLTARQIYSKRKGGTSASLNVIRVRAGVAVTLRSSAIATAAAVGFLTPMENWSTLQNNTTLIDDEYYLVITAISGTATDITTQVTFDRTMP